MAGDRDLAVRGVKGDGDGRAGDFSAGDSAGLAGAGGVLDRLRVDVDAEDKGPIGDEVIEVEGHDLEAAGGGVIASGQLLGERIVLRVTNVAAAARNRSQHDAVLVNQADVVVGELEPLAAGVAGFSSRVPNRTEEFAASQV